jgi:hypothetical protein
VNLTCFHNGDFILFLLPCPCVTDGLLFLGGAPIKQVGSSEYPKFFCADILTPNFQETMIGVL